MFLNSSQESSRKRRNAKTWGIQCLLSADGPPRPPSLIPTKSGSPGSAAVSGSAEPLEAAAAGQSRQGFGVRPKLCSASTAPRNGFLTEAGIPAETLTFTAISPLLPESPQCFWFQAQRDKSPKELVNRESCWITEYSRWTSACSATILSRLLKNTRSWRSYRH